MNPIGVIRTCFTEKFGVPRQSRMLSEARGIVKLNPNPDFAKALNHLETFSHLWIVFLFDKIGNREWRPIIDPPRVGAPPNMGVFASRSPHRPNPIGISAVKLDGVDLKTLEIHVSGVDILDGTPVLDIKPYVPFADSIPEANGGWADGEIKKHSVAFDPACEAVLGVEKKLIEQMLELDPRPTSQREAFPIGARVTKGKRFAFRVGNFDVHWEDREGIVFVCEIRKLGN